MSQYDLSAAAREASDRVVFPEPWQAQVFAMTLALHQKGLFSWSEWSESLSTELKRCGAADDASDYYDCWLRSLEAVLVAKGVAARSEVDAVSAAWQRAAHATPHGKPILLENDPQASGR